MPDVFINKSGANKKTAPKNNLKIKSGEHATIVENHIHSMSSFCQNPQRVAFQNQEPDEKIILFLRKHFITNLSWIFGVLILSIIPVLIIVINNNFGNIFVFNFPAKYITIGAIFYYLAVFAYAFISFISWYYNISLVTNQRIVDIDYSDIVYHNVAMTKLNLVEDVNYTQTGFIRSLFDYGDIIVQTAGTNENFDFLAVPHPAKATDIIENLIGGPR